MGVKRDSLGRMIAGDTPAPDGLILPMDIGESVRQSLAMWRWVKISILKFLASLF